MFELCPGRWVGPKESVFIIAEIGQNHQGDLELAKKLILGAKMAGADCVKFQKSDLKEKFTPSVLDKVYSSQNSFGSTYGEHKAFLEFSHEEYRTLQSYAHDQVGIYFTASAMDWKSADFLTHDLKVPFLKIGSGDSNNPLLIEHVAKMKNVNLVLSTGMSTMDGVKKMVEIIRKHRDIRPNNFAILQCTSSYPTKDEDINLRVITEFQEQFPDIVIGYSGHELGYLPTLGAVSLGAKIVERHVTLDKSQKGSDHGCSVDMSELERLVNDIRRLEVCLGTRTKSFLESESPCFEKLGKSVVARLDLKSGQTMAFTDLCVKVSDPKGCDPFVIEEKVIGRILNRDVRADTPINLDDLK